MEEHLFRQNRDNAVNKVVLSKQTAGAEQHRIPKMMSKVTNSVFDSNGHKRDAINIGLRQLAGFGLRNKGRGSWKQTQY